MNRLIRTLNILELLEKKSHFLFGPRSSGKSSLIRDQLSDGVVINLLRAPIFLRLASSPGDLESLIAAEQPLKKGLVVAIDEIQKLPILLDEVHRLIEEYGLKFLLTGSSARKLKASGVNLLAGRAWIARLYSLTFDEIPSFKLERMLRFGGLPHVHLSEDPQAELDAYVETYLKEEIKAEGLVRKIPAFAAFLKTAALANGQLLNFAEIASDVGVSAPTVREYYRILEDTLIGTLLEPWGRAKSRKSVATSRFYFFDTGVVHTLALTETLDRNSDLYGRSFEHWIFMELRAWLSYRRRRESLSFWRSVDQREVDFLIGDDIAIEVKASVKLSAKHLAGLQSIKDEGTFRHLILVSQDPVETFKDGIRCVHWRTFMERLWRDELFA